MFLQVGDGAKRYKQKKRRRGVGGEGVRASLPLFRLIFFSRSLTLLRIRHYPNAWYSKPICNKLIKYFYNSFPGRLVLHLTGEPGNKADIWLKGVGKGMGVGLLERDFVLVSRSP